MKYYHISSRNMVRAISGGVVDAFRWPRKQFVTSILVVCSANMSRLPMAEVLLRAHAVANGHESQVHSAGTSAVFGAPAAENAITAMAELGFDISSHRSRPIRREYIEDARVILVMSRHHRDDITRDFGLPPSNLFLFNELVGNQTDVDDPIGHPVDSFLDCARQLDSSIRSGFEWLVASAE